MPAAGACAANAVRAALGQWAGGQRAGGQWAGGQRGRRRRMDAPAQTARRSSMVRLGFPGGLVRGSELRLRLGHPCPAGRQEFPDALRHLAETAPLQAVRLQ
ncbi:hypothetical protein GCM10012280_25220 [Wenjunlia tyrosinilytica]|uniref:Uncharacterized protein n=1 Tax=Wenjunlia tyrosinilytica TaxID=1544741 RepID=A0A917ZNR1_9ACTN|nr:hypothetical protein GCM10012280_25220 [Wenjunlia tyrosinilytica]